MDITEPTGHTEPNQTISRRLPTGPYKPGSIGGYLLKNYRPSSIGREGGAFSATLYRDAKRVMLVENDGSGGGNRYFSPKAGDIRAEQAALDDTARLVMGEEELTRYFEADGFIALLVIASDFARHAAKYGFEYQSVVAASIDGIDFLEEAERAALTHPEKFSDQ